jgi:hypothetical protein
VLSQHLSQPLSLDVPLTSQTRPHGIDKHQVRIPVIVIGHSSRR